MGDTTAIVTLPTSTSPEYVQQVVGRKSQLSSDIEEFRGIPYGVVPARWEHSLLRQSLPQDIYDASSNGPKCPQPPEMNNSDYYQAHLDFPTDVVESEFECLNLFIVRPSPAALTRIGCDVSGSGIPVFVWIHGGGYGFGASTDPIWDPTRLVMRSISFRTPFIAVCLNYRLNIFGFAASSNILNTQSESQFKGCNFGLRDQKVALTWISQNISSFGGDPRNITLGGQSAGASSVHVHTLEAKLKHERPLFRRAIIQSGAIGCLGPISLETANTHWEELCQKLGLQNKDEVTRMRHLRSMTAADLLYASRSLSWITFPVVIDNLSVADTTLDCKVKVDFGDVNEVALVTEDTDDGSIAILIGDTDAEGNIFSHQISQTQTFDQVQSIFREVYPSISSSDEVLLAYGITPDISLHDLHHRLIRFTSDVIFGYPIYCAKRFLSTYQPKNILSNELVPDCGQDKALDQDIHYTTVQSYRVEFGNPFPGPNQNVAHHCVDMIYLFDAFHDVLMAADSSSQESEVSRDEYYGPSPLPVSATDSGYGSPPDSPQAKQTSEKSCSAASSGHRNSDLVLTMQTQWIRFIVGEGSWRKEDLGQNCVEDLITVYDKERAASVENFLHGPKWVEQRKRYEVLARHPLEMRLAHKKITHSVLT